VGQISIAGLLGFVVVFALGLAALISASDFWLGAIFLLTIGLLLASVLAVVFRGRRAVGWVGAAVFGWGYFLLGNISGLGLYATERRISDAATRWIFQQSNTYPVHLEGLTGPEVLDQYAEEKRYGERSANAGHIGYWLSVLVVAEIGALLAGFLARERRSGEPASNPSAPR
jgi:hypothetical protein